MKREPPTAILRCGCEISTEMGASPAQDVIMLEPTCRIVSVIYHCDIAIQFLIKCSLVR